jgi:HSP20 family protein
MPDSNAPHNPFAGVTDYFSELNRLRQRGLYGSGHGQEDRQRTHASAWVPATDIFVRGDDLVIRVELAGVSPEEVNLGFAHGVLTVSGSRRSEIDEDGGDSFYVRERFYGEFRRAITLPEGTEPEQVSAEFADGLVEIVVRGGAQAPDGQRIEVRDRSRGRTTRSLG